MKKKIILIGMMLMITLFSGCIGEEKPDCVVTDVNSYWSEEYDAFFVQVWVHNYGGKGNVHIGCTVTQNGQTYSKFWFNTVCAGCDDLETIRMGEIKRGQVQSIRGWVKLA